MAGVSKDDVLGRIHDVGLVPVVRAESADEALRAVEAICAGGVPILEITMTVPGAIGVIEAVTRRFGADALVGAGTVLTAAEVDRVHGAGGRVIVAPNCEPAVIRRALDLGLRVLPGIATATEAFTAINAGATELKLFPAASYGAKHLKALKSVLPRHVRVFPVGGIGAQDIAEWLASGADGFGFGSELFTPAYTLAQIETRARGLFDALRAAMKK